MCVLSIVPKAKIIKYMVIWRYVLDKFLYICSSRQINETTMNQTALNINQVNKDLYQLYQDKQEYLDENLNHINNMNHICLKCPEHYCDKDNERIMFIRLVYGDSFYKGNETFSLDDKMTLYENAVDNDYNQLDSPFANYIQKVNNNINPQKTKNYICTYVRMFNTSSTKKLIDTDFYKRTVELLRQEIHILQPKFIFFIDLYKICTNGSSKKKDAESEFNKENYEAQYDFLKDIFGIDVSINYHINYKNNYSIEGITKPLKCFCFRVNSLDSLDSEITNIFVNTYVNQFNEDLLALSSIKPYIEDSQTRQKKLNKICLNNYYSHTYSIDITENLVALIGENDVGKTSVLRAIDSFHRGDENVKNKVSIEIDNKSINVDDLKKSKNVINYHWFKTETYNDKDIENKTITELIKSKIGNEETIIVLAKLRRQIYEILEIFKYIDAICTFLDADIQWNIEHNYSSNSSKELKNVLNTFLKDRDILVLTFYKFRYDEDSDSIEDYYKNIKDDYPEDNTDIIQLKHNLDSLYNILNQFCLDFNLLDRIYSENNGTDSMNGVIERGLFKKLNEDMDLSSYPQYYKCNSLSLFLLEDELDSRSDSKYYDDFLEQQKTLKRQYFYGPKNISVIDDNFLKFYGYDVLFLNGSPKEIINRTQEIQDNLDIYISRRLDTSIIDKWRVLLNSFTSGDSVPIEKRGAGVRRICSLFSSMVDDYRILNIHKCPTAFAIDEIELSLHPKQQREFIKLLKDKLSKDFQFIITTHSPYVVNELNENNIAILRKDNLGNTIVESPSNRVLNYPSLAEINYIAFDEPSIDYHIELYGYIQNKLTKNVSEVDRWLKDDCSVPDSYIWYNVKPKDPRVHLTQDPIKRTLPFCVRNHIDHPLNDDITNIRQHTAYENNKVYADKDKIKESIDILIKAIKTHPNDFR